MGKRRVGFKNPKGGISRLKNAVSSDEDDDKIEKDLENMLDDEIGRYNNYKEEELAQKALKGRKKKKAIADDDDEEQEIFGIDVHSNDEDDEPEEGDIEGKFYGKGDYEMGSDEDEEVEDEEDDIMEEDGDDGVPDVKAWGKKPRAFHSTDYIDQDFGGFEGNDAEMAEQEEMEAKEIQNRLMAELDEDDFFGFLPSGPPPDPSTKSSEGRSSKEIIKMDFDALTMPERRKLVERECPEVIHLLEEYQEKLEIAEQIKELMKDETSEFIKKFYDTKYHTILNYCINISYFLYLRSSNPNFCKGHPVTKRIVQFKRLLEELNDFNVVRFKQKEAANALKLGQEPAEGIALKSHPKPQGIIQKNESDEDGSEEEEGDEEDGEKEVEKRGITYEMAKNKGLTPHRKKEQRNPRVKHRLKFRKANIRRKGQVRKPRKETTRYGGELTGINPYVTKSIKLK